MKASVLTIALLAAGALLPRAAAAQDDAPSYTIEDVTACSADAMKLCRDKLPDIRNIETCMKEHYAQLRPKCQKRFR